MHVLHPVFIKHCADQAVITSIGRGRGLCPDLRREISGKWGFWKLYPLKTCQHSKQFCFRMSVKLLHPSQSLKFYYPIYTPAIQLINSLDKIDQSFSSQLPFISRSAPAKPKSLVPINPPCLGNDLNKLRRQVGKQKQNNETVFKRSGKVSIKEKIAKSSGKTGSVNKNKSTLYNFWAVFDVCTWLQIFHYRKIQLPRSG